MIDSDYEHNEQLALVHLNERFPKTGFEYVGQNYKHWDFEDEKENIFEIKIRSKEMASRKYEDCLMERYKWQKLNTAAKKRGVNAFIICAEPFDVDGGQRVDYYIFKVSGQKYKWEDAYCNITTNFENNNKKVKKVTYLDKKDAKITFSILSKMEVLDVV